MRNLSKRTRCRRIRIEYRDCPVLPVQHDRPVSQFDDRTGIDHIAANPPAVRLSRRPHEKIAVDHYRATIRVNGKNPGSGPIRARDDKPVREDDKIRTLTNIVTLTRNTGTVQFVTTATYDEQTRKVVNLSISNEDLNNTSVEVGGIVNGYTISINGTPVNNGTIYPN